MNFVQTVFYYAPTTQSSGHVWASTEGASLHFLGRMTKQAAEKFASDRACELRDPGELFRPQAEPRRRPAKKGVRQ